MLGSEGGVGAVGNATDLDLVRDLSDTFMEIERLSLCGPPGRGLGVCVSPEGVPERGGVEVGWLLGDTERIEPGGVGSGIWPGGGAGERW